MKILLLNPLQVHLVNNKGKIYNRIWTPLSLANCAALLEKEGHDVKIIDANAEKLSPEEVSKKSGEFDKIFITSSTLDRWQCPVVDLEPFLNYTRVLKENNKEIFIIGAHGTVRPKEMLELTGAKAIIRGEPELTVLEICRNNKLSSVKGISYNDNSNFISNPQQDFLDLDSLPIPAFHLLPMDKYFYEVLGKNFTLLEGSRGCTFSCSFFLLDMYGKKLRAKSPSKLIAEIDTVVNKFAVKNIYFMDLEFTVNRTLVMEVCDYLIGKKYDLNWTCQTRFDLIDEELLQRMQSAGCKLIHFGVEAADNNALKTLGKGLTVEKIERGIKMVKKANIRTACFFLMGALNSNLNDVKNIIRFSKKLNPTYAVFHIAIPYPGTKFYNDVLKSGVKFSDNSIFPEAYVGNIGIKELKFITRKAYIEYYIRPRYIISLILRGHLKYLYQQIKLLLGFISQK